VSGTAHAAGGRLNAELTRSAVAVYRRHLGRGPTRAQAFVRQDIVVVVLRDVMTPPERGLVRGGHAEEARGIRRGLHEAMRPDLATAVTELTGADVIAAIGDGCPEPDVDVHVFLLERSLQTRKPA
jgi:uncharacterized protein YbcI